MWIPPYGERAQSAVLMITRAPHAAPGAAALGFHFQLEHARVEGKPCRRLPSPCRGKKALLTRCQLIFGHCCQHFWVGWGLNRIKGGLRRGKCQRDKQALQIFLGRLQLDDTDVVVYKGSKTPRPCCRAVERACFGRARSVALVTSINMAGGACKCGVSSLVHRVRRKFDRSHGGVAVLCAGVSFSWARPTQQPNESWVSRRI